MSLDQAEVRRIAALAQLDVAEADLARLTNELATIVAYVGHLAGSDDVPPPQEVPVHLRPDVVAPAPLSDDPGRFAPEFRDGLFLVPRLNAMDGP